ncbi:MAG TPA: DUF3667 domain-containing protein [Gemmatimonadota bacterium]|nr:DUF3667 domain-containing protein [Gemmatimonadota bacterium]
MTAPIGQVVTCANCGRSFNGRFCPDCGQDLEDIRRPFAEIARDFLGDFLAFDARIWRTLVPLFTRPGGLTVDYVEGRRARYVPPLKLYVFAAFLYFTIVAIGGGGPFAGFVQETEDGITVGIGGPRDRPADENSGGDAQQDATDQAPGLGRALDERAQRAAQDPEAYGRAVQGTLSYAHFLLLPVLALLLKAFYRRRYYAEHLVFGMHFHAFALLPAAVIVAAVDFVPGLGPNGTAANVMATVWWLGVGAYFFLALRRTYGGSFLGTLGRWAAVGFLYAMLAAVILMLVAFLTLWLY